MCTLACLLAASISVEAVTPPLVGIGLKRTTSIVGGSDGKSTAPDAYGQGLRAPFRTVIVADLNLVLSLTAVAVTVTVLPIGAVPGQITGRHIAAHLDRTKCATGTARAAGEDHALLASIIRRDSRSPDIVVGLDGRGRREVRIELNDDRLAGDVEDPHAPKRAIIAAVMTDESIGGRSSEGSIAKS